MYLCIYFIVNVHVSIRMLNKRIFCWIFLNRTYVVGIESDSFSSLTACFSWGCNESHWSYLSPNLYVCTASISYRGNLNAVRLMTGFLS